MNGGVLDGSPLIVTSDDARAEDEHHHAGDHHIEQSDKPRAGSKLLCTLHQPHHFFINVTVAAEYIAKGYTLSDSILQRAIDMDSTLQGPRSVLQSNKFIEKHGISQKFLNYFQSIDKTIGERTLGPQQTISAKVQTTVEQATQKARAFDEQKGFSKIATDVRLSSSFMIYC